MAENKKTTKFACEDPKGFCDKLFWDVYVPRFMEKCASVGVPISNARDFWDAYETAARLDYMERVQASATPVKVAADLLRSQMANVGL